jgi:hypothetical protein
MTKHRAHVLLIAAAIIALAPAAHGAARSAQAKLEAQIADL